MASRLEQEVDARLRLIRDLVRSGATEMVGKVIREEGSGKIVGRHGGMSRTFPEIEGSGVSPGRIATAVERGRGIVYDRVRGAVRRELVRTGQFLEPRRRSPERPTVPPHERLTRKCKVCGVAHGRGAHRFHGEGSFHQTHLFSFNPEENTLHKRPVAKRRKKKQIRRTVTTTTRQTRVVTNPGPVQIYGQVLSIIAKKGRGHQCSAACRRANHTYIHRFKTRPMMTGSADRKTLMIGKPIGGRNRR